MKKKGFTLIELLAVIVIISVLGLLVVPNVIKQYNNTVQKNVKIQENQILDAANVYIDDNCSRHASSQDRENCNNNFKELGINFGDVDFNGSVQVMDSTYIKMCISGRKNCNSLQVLIGDINQNGVLDYEDTDLIRDNVTGLSNLPTIKYICLRVIQDKNLIGDISVKGSTCNGSIIYSYKDGQYSKGITILKCGNSYSTITGAELDNIYNYIDCFN